VRPCGGNIWEIAAILAAGSRIAAHNATQRKEGFTTLSIIDTTNQMAM
jgi:hypothetical protein